MWHLLSIETLNWLSLVARRPAVCVRILAPWWPIETSNKTVWRRAKVTILMPEGTHSFPSWLSSKTYSLSRGGDYQTGILPAVTLAGR
jgi:hypothetical protein